MEKIMFFILWVVFIVSSNIYPSDEKPTLINGIRPPTPEEWEYIKGKIVKIEKIEPNVLSMNRYRASPSLKFGLPSYVKNWEYLPAVGNQGAQGSCAAWAICYYYKTYQEARERNLRNPNPSLLQNMFLVLHLAII